METKVGLKYRILYASDTLIHESYLTCEPYNVHEAQLEVNSDKHLLFLTLSTSLLVELPMRLLAAHAAVGHFLASAAATQSQGCLER